MFKKRRVRLIDEFSFSSISTGVWIESWGEPKIHHVETEVRITDCSRSIIWHEFGETEQEALDKADSVISAMLALKADIKTAYLSIANQKKNKGKRLWLS